MKIGIPTEVRPGETRVAATPETVKKYCAGGQNAVFVQAGAGAELIRFPGQGMEGLIRRLGLAFHRLELLETPAQQQG